MLDVVTTMRYTNRRILFYLLYIIIIIIIIRLHRLHTLHRCNVLREMSHLA